METVVLLNARRENRLRHALLGPELPLRALLAGRYLSDHCTVELLDPAADPRWRRKLFSCLRRSPVAITLVFSDLGIDSGGDELSQAVDLSRSVKSFCGVPVLWTGVKGRVLASLVLKEASVLAVAETETALAAACRALVEKQPLDGLAGIWTRNNLEGSTDCSPADERCDFFPLPLHLLPMERYVRKTAYGPHIPLETSRGCFGCCAFCNNRSQRRWVGATAEALFDEVRRLHNRLGVKAFSFIDDNFFMDFPRAGTFFELVLKHKLPLRFDIQGVRADVVDALTRDELILMERAGCVKLSIGVETGSKRLLEKMGKNLDLSSVLHLNRRLKEWTICPQYHFILGLPGETRKDLKKTVSLVDRLLMDNHEACFYPFFYRPIPQSALWSEVVDKVTPPSRLEEWDDFLLRCRKELAQEVSSQEYQALYCALAGRSHRGFIKAPWLRHSLGFYAPLAWWRIDRGYWRAFPEVWLMEKLG